MSVSTGNSITAAQYNGLQSRVETVLGNGSTNFGYGQAVTSGQVTTATDSITAAQMDNLRTDMNKIHVHQVGTNIGIRNIAVGDVIGADQSATNITYDNLGNPTFVSPDTTGGFNDYLSAMDDLESAANRFRIDPGESTAADILTDTRTSSWNGTINMVFRCTFTSADARRHFFNSGGEIRIYSSMANAVSTKDSDWSSMITNPGTVKFGHNFTTVSGSTAGVTLNSIGNFDLTTSYQTVFTKTGNAAVYAENYWDVAVKSASSTTIDFRVQFADIDDGDEPIVPVPPGGIPGGVDEDVTGDITVTVATLRASGSNVSVNNPAIATTNTLE